MGDDPGAGGAGCDDVDVSEPRKHEEDTKTRTDTERTRTNTDEHGRTRTEGKKMDQDTATDRAMTDTTVDYIAYLIDVRDRKERLRIRAINERMKHRRLYDEDVENRPD